jgi:molecular chaperone HscB
MNCFEWFGMPVAYRIDDNALRRAFLLNSKKFHPDFYTTASEAEQAEVLEKSTLNNQAYNTLADPDTRLRHILELAGALNNNPNQNETLPQDFLMNMMDINEQIMELSAGFDESIYQSVQQQVQQFENELLSEAEPALDAYQTPPEQPALLIQLKNFYLKKKYLLRIKENLSTFAPA